MISLTFYVCGAIFGSPQKLYLDLCISHFQEFIVCMWYQIFTMHFLDEKDTLNHFTTSPTHICVNFNEKNKKSTIMAFNTLVTFCHI